MGQGQATAERVASNIAAIRAAREARKTDLKHLAWEAQGWAYSLSNYLFDAAHAEDDAALREAISKAFRMEVALLPRMTALADQAPESARSGREYGWRLRAASDRAPEVEGEGR